MQVEELSIPDVNVLTPKKHNDGRGFFSETYSRRHRHLAIRAVQREPRRRSSRQFAAARAA